MDFWTALERLGFPIACVGGLSWFVWQLFKWLGKNIVEPITKSHIALVESAKQTNDINVQTLQNMGKLLQGSSTVLEKVYQQTSEIHSMTTSLCEKT